MLATGSQELEALCGTWHSLGERQAILKTLSLLQ